VPNLTDLTPVTKLGVGGFMEIKRLWLGISIVQCTVTIITYYIVKLKINLHQSMYVLLIFYFLYVLQYMCVSFTCKKLEIKLE